MQNTYIWEMADFFAYTISPEYLDHLAFLSLKANTIDIVNNTICELSKAYLLMVEQNENDIDRIAEEAGIDLKVWYDKLANAIEVAEQTGSTAPFEEIFYSAVNDFSRIASLVVEAVSIPEGLFASFVYLAKIRDMHLVSPAFENMDYASEVAGAFLFAIDQFINVVELGIDSDALWNLTEAFAKDCANGLILSTNMDLLEELRRAPRAETRRAAQFLYDAYNKSNRSAWSVQWQNIAVTTTGQIVDFVKFYAGVAFPPAGVVFAAAAIIDTGVGFSADRQTRAQIFVLSDMTDSTNRLIGRAYFRDEVALYRHLTNLANLRVVGEKRAMSLRVTGSGNAEQNKERVEALAESMGLTIFPR